MRAFLPDLFSRLAVRAPALSRRLAWVFAALLGPLAAFAPNWVVVLAMPILLLSVGMLPRLWVHPTGFVQLTVGFLVWLVLSAVWSPSPHAPAVALGVAMLLGVVALLPHGPQRRMEGTTPGQALAFGLALPFGSVLLGGLALAGIVPPGRAETAAALLAVSSWPAGMALGGWVAAFGNSRLPVLLSMAVPPMAAAGTALATGGITVLAGLAAGGLIFAAAALAVRPVRIVLGVTVLLLTTAALPLAQFAGSAFPGRAEGPPSWPWDWTGLWASVAELALKAPIIGHGLDSTRMLLSQAATACRLPQRTIEGTFVDLKADEQLAISRSLGYAGTLGTGGLSGYLAVHPDLHERFTAMDSAGRWTVPFPDHPCALRFQIMSGRFAELAPENRYAVARSLGYDRELGKGGLSRHLDAHPDLRRLFQEMEEARRWPVHDRHRFCVPQVRTAVGRFRDLPADDQRAVAQALGYWEALGQGGLSRHLATHPTEAARFDTMERDFRWPIHTVFCPEGAWAVSPALDGESRLAGWPDTTAADGPIHPRNGFLQLWFELGEVGVALVAFLALDLLGRTRFLPPTNQLAGLALFATVLVMGGIGGGPGLFPLALPWLSGVLFAGLALRVPVRPVIGDPLEAGGVLVIHTGGRIEALLLQDMFAAIHRYHRGQRVVLLTSPALAGMMRGFGIFDAVWEEPAARSLSDGFGARMRLRNARFLRIYDFEGDRRPIWLQRLDRLGHWPGEAGPEVISCCATTAPQEQNLPIRERCRRRLAGMGIEAPPRPDLSWLAGDVAGFGLPSHYALLIVDGSRTDTRTGAFWPVTHQVEVVGALWEAGVQPVVLGTTATVRDAANLRARCPQVVDLTAGISLPQLASLARGAVAAVGVRSPLLHLVAAVGCPTVVLATGDGPPDGPRVRCLDAPASSMPETTDILATVVELTGLLEEGTDRPWAAEPAAPPA